MRPDLRQVIAQHPAATLILVLFVLLASAYNLADPLFEPPDEILHTRFIRHIQHEGRLPVVQPDGPLSQDHQAPLYYALAAFLTAPLANEDIQPLLQINPHWGYNIGAVGDDNKNQYLHDPARTFLTDPATRAMHLTRLLSTVFGIGSVVLTYVLALRFLDKPLAAATMAIVAFTPNFLLTNAAVTNDAPVIFFTVAAAVVMVNLMASVREPPLWAWAGLAILFGMGMLSKLSFWPILPACAIGVGLMAYRVRSWRMFVYAGFILLGGVILMTGWWALRNIRLYGEWTGLSAMWATWGVRSPITLSGYMIEIQNFRTTFWANFGYGNVPMPEWVYSLINVFLLGGAVGLIFLGLRWLREKRPLDAIRRDQLIFLATWTILTALGLLWYMQRTFSVTGRQLFPVFAPIALGLAAGWASYVPRRWQPAAAGILSGLMLVFAVGALVGVLIPAYRPSPRWSVEAAEQTVPHRLDWRIGEVARLVGYDVSPQVVRPDEVVMVTLYWEPLREVDRNYSVFVHLFGEEVRQVGGRDTYPGLGNDPTTTWKPGEVIEDRIPVTVDDAAAGPILLDIEVGLYELETVERLETVDAAGNAIGYPVIGTVKLHDPNAMVAEADLGDGWTFQDGTILQDYMISPEEALAGMPVTITLTWVSAGPLPANYSVFVHLVDEAGAILTQGDGAPRQGRYPTTAWGAGERFTDSHILTLPGDLPPGAYSLLIGLYDGQRGVRLPLAAGGDHVRLEHAIVIR